MTETQDMKLDAAEDAPERQLASWRTELEELRVQVALAEMEAKKAGAEVRAVVEKHLPTVQHAIDEAAREVGAVLGAVRDQVRRVVR